MTAQLYVDVGRTNIVQVSLGYDVSADNFSSEIRDFPGAGSTVIATWAVAFLTDGTDGELVLTLDNSITSAITETIGWMDIKRLSNAEPLSVFGEPIQVIFQETVTV